jgi:hypothetical protein
MGDHCHIIAKISKESAISNRQEILLEGENEDDLHQSQPGEFLSFLVKNDKMLLPGSVVMVKIDVNKLIVL